MNFLPSDKSVIDIIDYHAELFNINAAKNDSDVRLSSSGGSEIKGSDKL